MFQRARPTLPPIVQQYEEVLDMVHKLHSKLGLITLDNDKIKSVCNQLLIDNKPGTGLLVTSLDWLRKSLDPIIQRDLIDNEGTSGSPGRAPTPSSMGSGSLARILQSCRGNIVRLLRHQPQREHIACDMSIPRQPLGRPACVEIPDAPLHRVGQEGCQNYRPAAPIQHFNNKSLNWPAWFRHFRAVADVHGWDKTQRALQLVSYMDETAMNDVQELRDDELHDYDILVKPLSDRFDPASRVSAFRSRFHGWSRRHHEDADSFSEPITELCCVGYPQSSPELRQELISEQFVRGQSDSELEKYLWLAIRTQKDQKLQTLIEVCTDFASLRPSVNIHRPGEQAFAVEEDDGSEEMFAMMDRSQWTGQGVSESTIPPSLVQMLALTRTDGI